VTIAAGARLDAGHLFCSMPRRYPSTALAPRGVNDRVSRYAAATGLPPELRGAHVLRHTALTTLYRRCRQIEIVQRLAGHADVRTTMRYVELVADDLARAVRDAYDDPRREANLEHSVGRILTHLDDLDDAA
jgi:integrase